MSRKNQGYRSWLYQNPTGTTKDAWDAAWANEQGRFASLKHEEQQATIAQLQAERRWIPCEELLPSDGWVLVTNTLGHVELGVCTHGRNCHEWGGVPPTFGDPTHWMKLPAAPGSEE